MNVRVIGLGNVLMSDDGFGPYVARVLEAFYDLPRDIQVIDGGSPGMALAPCLLDADFVILVDTVKAAGEPGDTHVYQYQEILDLAPAPWLSPHDRDIRDALRTLASAGKGPADVLLVGVIPEWVATGVRLSQPVRAAVAPVIGLIVNELERLGYRLPMRTLPRQPDTWWEREAGTLAGVAG